MHLPMIRKFCFINVCSNGSSRALSACTSRRSFVSLVRIVTASSAPGVTALVGIIETSCLDGVLSFVDVLDDEIEKIVAVNFSDSTISGDFMDWLLRYNYRRTYLKNENGTEVRIFGVDEVEIEPLLEIIRNFGLNPQLIEETELELELNEESN